MDAPTNMPATLERGGECQSELVERIARLIDPEAWSRWDNQPSGDIKQGSVRVNWTITVARRVIDGLNLDED